MKQPTLETELLYEDRLETESKLVECLTYALQNQMDKHQERVWENY